METLLYSFNFQETSHNHSTFKTNKQKKFFAPGITWSHHVLREFRGRWFEYRLTGLAGACRRSHWYFGEVPVGGGSRESKGNHVMLLQGHHGKT